MKSLKEGRKFMKKVLITLLSTLILSTYAFAAIPVQVLDQKIDKVNSNINWTHAGMTARQVSMFFDDEKYDTMNSILSSAFIVISMDLAKFNRPIANIQKDIDLIRYVESLDAYTAKFANNPELQQAALDLLTHSPKSPEYREAKAIFDQAIDAQKEDYHAKLESMYGSYNSFYALWTRLNDTLKEGTKYPLEYDLEKLESLNRKNYNHYANFAKVYGDNTQLGLDELSERINNGIDALTPEVNSVIENYNHAVGIYDSVKLVSIVADIAIDLNSVVSESYIEYSPLEVPLW